jgi:hypothetical protein
MATTPTLQQAARDAAANPCSATLSALATAALGAAKKGLVPADSGFALHSFFSCLGASVTDRAVDTIQEMKPLRTRIDSLLTFLSDTEPSNSSFRDHVATQLSELRGLIE